MTNLELITQEWMSQEIVTSPLYGKVEEVLIAPNQRVTEWEPLFIIKNLNGTFQQITVGISGILCKVNVNKNDPISPGMVMAHIKADE